MSRFSEYYEHKHGAGTENDRFARRGEHATATTDRLVRTLVEYVEYRLLELEAKINRIDAALESKRGWKR